MPTDFLAPSQNQLKKWARLDGNKFRRETGIFLAEGVKVVEELLDSDWSVDAILVLPEKETYWKNLLDRADKNISVYSISGSQWRKISQDKEPEGIMAVVKIRPEAALPSFLTSAAGHILILHEINNPGNLGALLRSALWFGFNNIVLSANSVDYTHPKSVRTSMGCLFHLTIVSDIDLMDALPQIRKTHYLVGSEVRRGREPHILQKKTALLLGSESHGLPDALLEITEESWNIPGNRRADSLSLPQAAAILMYECSRRGS
jgi:TrmH family RNA methyltransferase